MAVTNKFKIYGQEPLDTDDLLLPNNEAYDSLYAGGIKHNTTAKARDVLTPLRETTLVNVAFLSWLAGQEGLVDISDFEDTLNPTTALNNIVSALTQALTNKINSKEPTITKNNGFLKSDGTNWSWDSNTYQIAYQILSDINTYFTTANNEGLLYKAKNDANLKSTNKAFVYFDSDEETSNGNHILHLKSFDYSDN